MPILAQKVCLAIGSFDGCHLGHQELLIRTKSLARKLSADPAVLTFDPSPQVFFRKSGPEGLIFSRTLKHSALLESGMEVVVVHRFDETFSKVAPEQFVRSLLLGQLRVAGVVVGADFKYGADRKGDVELLKSLLAGKAPLEVCEAESHKGNKISSSAIRTLLVTDGNVELAQDLLGRPFAIEGIVVHGRALGKKIGFATANITVDPTQLLPKPGVYAGFMAVEGVSPLKVLTQPENSWPAVFNVGFRPTMAKEGEAPGTRPTVEGHALDGLPADLPDIYGKKVLFFLTHRLRDEQKFPSPQALANQIKRDVDKARELLKPKAAD